ncbi:hypothetical protein [Neobacillus vireti]|uniref:Uncharacterized protein n=1 Tax=Neobacillus vireti LMG 21834 TaxID=1131730 RepID=A0AB94IUB0_9BACI|nr:hypothetical protein [Neobacillus vireti]ETI70596.1 hypothetical protein BAVI_01440 [Neobacillus vireti LMG 21834]KLT15328.1 hypothetical protein AA980_24485 [Neobacillus vireti]
MELIKVEDVKRFVGGTVEIVIHDAEGGDQAPAVRKTVKKVQLCPDSTHIRFYFDDFYFLAVPLSSRVSESDEQWSAFDPESGLTYTVKKVQVF